METSFCWQPPLLLFTPRMVYSLSPFPLPVSCHQGNNTCFYGKCYYCRESEPACAEGEIMEGSLTLWLPDVWPLQKHRHPWGRTYREGKLARLVLAASSPRQHSTPEKNTNQSSPTAAHAGWTKGNRTMSSTTVCSLVNLSFILRNASSLNYQSGVIRPRQSNNVIVGGKGMKCIWRNVCSELGLSTFHYSPLFIIWVKGFVCASILPWTLIQKRSNLGEKKTMTCVCFIQTTRCSLNGMYTQLSSSVASCYERTHHNLLFFSLEKRFQFLQAEKIIMSDMIRLC